MCPHQVYCSDVLWLLSRMFLLFSFSQMSHCVVVSPNVPFCVYIVPSVLLICCVCFVFVLYFVCCVSNVPLGLGLFFYVCVVISRMCFCVLYVSSCFCWSECVFICVCYVCVLCVVSLLFFLSRLCCCCVCVRCLLCLLLMCLLNVL